MTLAPGKRLGPYEILSPIGAGGMGEVYRARDPRLGREVALKVLPAFFDPDRLRRFEREAQAAGSLNHPNITAVYDIGTQDGAPYVVMELLRGDTLRQRLAAGPLPARKAIDYAIQIARGLAAAHEAGIVHRDLKPENLFVTPDGRVKILDFGLAKLTQTDRESLLTKDSTATGTEPGVVLGTLGYMSPEQVKGMPADARSDIFSLGAILYETLSGKRAFRGDSAAETMSAILKEDPPDLSASNKNVSPGIERILRRCLEKSPEERIHSAHDLAFQLEMLSTTSGPTTAAAAGPRTGRRLWPVAALVALAAIAAAAAGVLAARKKGQALPPSYLQLTYRRGPVLSARFAPDGQTFLYTAAWDGKPMENFVGNIRSTDARPFGQAGSEILSISSSGEVLTSLNRTFLAADLRSGTLAQVSISGGTAPREILEQILWADWGPDGKSLALVRGDGGKERVEYPAGKRLFEAKGYVTDLRVSPDGESVAFIDHEAGMGDDSGVVIVLDRSGAKRWVSEPLATSGGLSWAPDGEIFFTAGDFVAGSAFNRALYSAKPGGKARLRARIPGSLLVHDISREGRVLMSKVTFRVGILGLFPGETRERDFTWRAWTLATRLSADGKLLLFGAPSAKLTLAGDPPPGHDYSVYVRKTDGSLPVRIGDGFPQSLSLDGKWALSLTLHLTTPQITAFPTGAGEPRRFPTEGRVIYSANGFLPDGKSFVFEGSEPGHGPRLYTVPFDGGKPHEVTPEGWRGALERVGESVDGVSPDGQGILVVGPDGGRYVYPLAGGDPRPIRGLAPEDSILGWGSDPRTIYVRKGSGLPARIVRRDLETGREEKWRDVMPEDAAGITRVGVRPTPGGEYYVYTYNSQLSDLFLVEGLK